MRAIEFLYWILGFIQAGNVKSFLGNSNVYNATVLTILDHLQLVEELNEYSDIRNKSSMDLYPQIKGLFLFVNVDDLILKKLETQILKAIDKDLSKPKTACAYYLQGAFELSADGDVDGVSTIMFSYDKVKDFPDSDLKQKLAFFNMLNGEYNLHIQQLYALKDYVDNIFEHVINAKKIIVDVEVQAAINDVKVKPAKPKPKYLEPVDDDIIDFTIFRC